MNYKAQSHSGLCPLKTIIDTEQYTALTPNAPDLPQLELINCHDFFEQLSFYLNQQNPDFSNIDDMIKSGEISEFDDSFEQFNIAELAVTTINRSDDPIMLSILLKFFGHLMEVDTRYLDCLVRADFLNGIYRVYREEQNTDCIIPTIQCASVIAQVSKEHRDLVFQVFQFPQNPTNTFTTEILTSIFSLILCHLQYEIDNQMMNVIVHFLFQELPSLVDKLQAANHNQWENCREDNRLFEIFYACIGILSDSLYWKGIILSVKEQIEQSQNVEMINPDQLNSFFLFIQESLLSDKKSLIKLACFALYNTISFYNVSDRITLVMPVFKLMISNNSPDVLHYVCDLFCLLLHQIDHNQCLIQLIKEYQIMPRVANHMFEMFESLPSFTKSRFFKVIFYLISVFPQNVPILIDLGLFNMIFQMIHYEDSDCVMFSILILDCIFKNEDMIYQNHQFLISFAENGGINDLVELMDNPLVTENSELYDSLGAFLASYGVNGEDIIITES